MKRSLTLSHQCRCIMTRIDKAMREHKATAHLYDRLRQIRMKQIRAELREEKRKVA